MQHRPPHRLHLDAFAAVDPTILTLNSSLFIQAPARTSRPFSHLNLRNAGLPLIFILISCLAPILIPTPDEPFAITTEIAGRISSIHIRDGEYVHTGDILIQLDTQDILTRKHSLESRIHFAELSGTSASHLYDALEQTNLDLTRFTITAPINGRIIFLRRLHPGYVIQPRSPIARILQKGIRY